MVGLISVLEVNLGTGEAENARSAKPCNKQQTAKTHSSNLLRVVQIKMATSAKDVAIFP